MDGENQPQPTSSDFNNAPAADATATDPNNITGMQETNEFGEPIQAEPVNELIPEEILADMVNLWSVFAMEQQDRVPISELRVLMRALDLDLNPTELAEVRKEIDPLNEGFIRFENLKKVMEGKLKEVDTYDDLIKEFQLLDKDGDGKIPAPEFKQYMKNMGSKMTQEQLDEMMKEADSKGDGSVDIEEFCQRLCPPKK